MKAKKLETSMEPTEQLSEVRRRIRRAHSRGNTLSVEVYDFKEFMKTDWFDPDDFENAIVEFSTKLGVKFRIQTGDYGMEDRIIFS